MAKRKHIYLTDEDQEMYDRAQALANGESLSSVIRQSLKRFVKHKEAEQQGFEEIEIGVGTPDPDDHLAADLPTVRFMGREIARQNVLFDAKDAETARYIIYQSKKGKFVLHTQKWVGEEGTYDYAIYDSLHELPDDVPNDVLNEAADHAGVNLSEFLDI